VQGPRGAALRPQHRRPGRRLRRKIEPDPAEPKIITTVRGGGYMFAPEVTRGGKDRAQGASTSAEGVGPAGA
jgi:two-component system OmpR family response regulator